MLTAMIKRLTALLREAPITLPAFAALALLIVWATSQGGYPLTHWAPGGLSVLALLTIALVASPPRLDEIPLGVKLALGCLAAYTALSFCSILWAGVPGDAWEGADRTLLYLLLFALFALWRSRGASAALLLSAWTLAMIALAAYVALRVRSSTGSGFEHLFAGDRFDYPIGYPNASAAQWLIAFWPALLLASGSRLPWALRGVFAGGAVLLADVALLSQSRGSLYATAVLLVLVFALVPQRLRIFATMVPVALAIGATAPLVLRVGERILDGQSPYPAVHTAVAAAFGAGVLVGLVVGLAAALESCHSRSPSPALARGVRRVVGVAAVGTLLAVIVGGLLAAGDPVARARSAWDSFKGGYSTSASSGTRLLSGLGSNRYDFYRVALDQFAAHPLVGIGTDNFSQPYLAGGHSDETPRYPHSVELRVLAQTGIFGAGLALLGLAGALTAGWRAMRRRRDPLAQTAAAAALTGFAYWVVHGSFDWFWEFAGLGGPAFALLGIACSLAPRPSPGRSLAVRDREPPERLGAVPPKRAAAPSHIGRGRRIALAILAMTLALAAVYAFAAPWLSEREIQSAARIWPHAPLTAYARLGDAADLNPLSDRPYLVAGSIALRFGDVARAERQFSLALRRVPRDAYATLELGAIASALGERSHALGLLRRTVRLNPRDVLSREALAAVRGGRRIDLRSLNYTILLRARRLA
jgi:tetratricopeptide (TPR) repeat protein